MGGRGEHNVGQLARERFGNDAYLVGFGTHSGPVAAAHDWGDPVEIMDVAPPTSAATSGSATTRVCPRSCSTCVIRANRTCAGG